MIEAIAVIFSLVSVWLTTKRNIWCWPIGIVGIVLYLYLFLEKGEYCNTFLQFFFIVQSIMGWLNWNKDDLDTITLWNEKLSAKKYTHLLFEILVTSFVYGFLSSLFGGNLTTLDSLTTGLSIIAMFLMARKKLESWILWIIADMLYIPLFIHNKMYLSSVTYFIFLILAINGFITWKKQLKNV
jgi:nicotinamide mononucleotide transporter